MKPMPPLFQTVPTSISSLLLILTLSLLLCFSPGCASLKDIFSFGDDKADVYLPAEQLIIRGMEEYNVGKYFLALEYFDEILDRYPFSPQAPLAELKAADCNYYLERYLEAAILYQEFEERHPTNEAIPYVMYQKAMSSYQRIDSIDRDISGAKDAIREFEALIRAFPESPYTQEAKARIRAATEFLANHDFYVVKFYLRTGKHQQAQTRLNYLLDTYPNSAIAPRAREILALIEAGNPPKSGFSRWFSDLSMPDWMDFFSFGDKAQEEAAEAPTTP